MTRDARREPGHDGAPVGGRPLSVRESVAERLVAACLACLACGCSPHGMPFGRRPPPSRATVCAFGIPGVRTSVRETIDGIDVWFGVVGDDPAELRRRAHGSIDGTYPLRPETRALARRVRVILHDEEDGLVMHVVPIDPTELDAIRGAVRTILAEDGTMSCK